MKVLYYISLILIFSSCSKSDERHSGLIHKLSLESLDDPSKYGGLSFFLDCDLVEKKKEISYYEIRSFYKERYSEGIPYDKFLKQLFNGEFLYGREECFLLDSTVFQSYNSISFDEFLSLNCELSDSAFFLKKDLNESESKTVLYYLFINEHYAFFDDYLGVYEIRKI